MQNMKCDLLYRFNNLYLIYFSLGKYEFWDNIKYERQ